MNLEIEKNVLAAALAEMLLVLEQNFVGVLLRYGSQHWGKVCPALLLPLLE